MLLTLYNIYTKKADIIKKTVEEQKEQYLERIYKLEEPFCIAFYEQCIESTVADAYESFVEMESGSNFFYENIKRMNQERGRRFYKLMGIYHTIKILRQKRMEIDSFKMKQSLIFVYELNENEQKLFTLLYRCACEYEGEFSALFAKAVAKYLFGKDNITPFSLAFIQNFCYNSYIHFIESFTKYVTIHMRLQRAANS